MKSSYIFDKIHAVFTHNIRMPTRHVGSTHQKMRPFWEGSRMLDPNFKDGTWRQKGCRQTASIPEFFNGFDQKSFPWILNDWSTDGFNERNIHVSSNADVGLWNLRWSCDSALKPPRNRFHITKSGKHCDLCVFGPRFCCVFYISFEQSIFCFVETQTFSMSSAESPDQEISRSWRRLEGVLLKVLHSWNLTNGYQKWPCLKEATFTKQPWGFNFTNLNWKVQDSSQNSQNFHERWRTTTQPTWKLLPQKLGEAKKGNLLKTSTHGERWEQGSEDNGLEVFQKLSVDSLTIITDQNGWAFRPKNLREKHHGILKIWGIFSETLRGREGFPLFSSIGNQTCLNKKSGKTKNESQFYFPSGFLHTCTLFHMYLLTSPSQRAPQSKAASFPRDQ